MFVVLNKNIKLKEKTIMLKKIVCMVISAFMLVSLITVFDTSEVSAANTLPAFPGAEGGGMYATGGRGGTGGSCNKFKMTAAQALLGMLSVHQTESLYLTLAEQ